VILNNRSLLHLPATHDTLTGRWREDRPTGTD